MRCEKAGIPEAERLLLTKPALALQSIRRQRQLGIRFDCMSMDDGSVEIMEGRVRICPYFFTDDAGRTSFGGSLATIVPADKKKIHGMSDGIIVPCVIDGDT